MKNILQLLFPAKCPFCGVVLGREEEGICAACLPHLPEVTEPCCKRCGKPIMSVEEEYCMDCSHKNSVLKQGTALWVYTDTMRKAMADFKYQAAYIAYVVGEEMGIPVLEDALLRTRNTSPQKGLNDKQRKENLEDAFAVNPVWLEEIAAHRKVLLVDDIYTTGATLETCGLTLKNAGVEEVYFICLCIGSDC